MNKKFNIFDIVIVIAIIAAIFLGYKMFTKTSEKSVNAVSEVTFTVEISRCENDLLEKIQIGDDIYDSQKGGYYGKVVDVYSKPYTTSVMNAQDGTFELAESETEKNIYIVIKGMPTSMTDANVQFASQKVKVGTVAYLKSRNYVGYGYVVGMELSK